MDGREIESISLTQGSTAILSMEDDLNGVAMRDVEMRSRLEKGPYYVKKSARSGDWRASQDLMNGDFFLYMVTRKDCTRARGWFLEIEL